MNSVSRLLTLWIYIIKSFQVIGPKDITTLNWPKRNESASKDLPREWPATSIPLSFGIIVRQQIGGNSSGEVSLPSHKCRFWSNDRSKPKSS